MDIFSVLTLVGGLALFLYGMELMGDGLKKLAGGRLELFLAKLTSNRFKGFLLGLIVTSIIQSSSATTVMLVGFVNSGIMKLSQTISIILGANIGTTVTAWLLSLTGINGETFWLNLLKPDAFSPILAVIGIIMIMINSNDRQKNIGSILVGFAILMFGMETMSGSMDGLKESESFSKLLVMFSNPVMGIIVGTLFTAIIQSSSASVGILQALSLTGAIPYTTAIPIIFGQNIGTTITPVLSAITGNVQSKRVAASCVYIKMIGVVIVATVFYALNAIFKFPIMDGSANVSVLTIAIIHTFFNIISTIIIMPFCNGIEKLAKITIKGKKQESDSFSRLDDRFLSMPSFAVEKCREVVFEMAELTKNGVIEATNLLHTYDKDIASKIKSWEDDVDKYEDKTSSYLVKISSCELSSKDSVEVTRLLGAVGDIERISDHSVNIMRAAKEINEKNIVFPERVKEDMQIMGSAVREIIEITSNALCGNNLEEAKKVEPLDQIIDKLKHKIKNNQVQRLRDGACTVEMGFILSDLLIAYERISGHCSNIAVSLIAPNNEALEAHDYLHHIKNNDENDFVEKYSMYKQKYSLKKD